MRLLVFIFFPLFFLVLLYPQWYVVHLACTGICFRIKFYVTENIQFHKWEPRAERKKGGQPSNKRLLKPNDRPHSIPWYVYFAQLNSINSSHNHYSCTQRSQIEMCTMCNVQCGCVSSWPLCYVHAQAIWANVNCVNLYAIRRVLSEIVENFFLLQFQIITRFAQLKLEWH